MKFEGVPSQTGRVEKKETKEWGEITGSIEYEYDAVGRVIRETTRDTSKELLSEGIFEYDAEGRRIRENWNDPDNNRSGVLTYIYDEKGTQIDKVWKSADDSSRTEMP